MKITDVKIVSFRTFADRFRAGTPQPHQELVQTVTSIETDTGVSGYYLGGALQSAGGGSRCIGGHVLASVTCFCSRSAVVLQGRLGCGPHSGVHPGHNDDACVRGPDPADCRRVRACALRQGRESAAADPGPGCRRGEQRTRQHLWRRRRDVSSGTYLLEELRRGGVGTMPWPSQPHAFVEIWNAWQAGNERQAVDIHEREIAPLARLSTAGLRLGHTIHKELLRRRGVIRHALVRAPSDPLDEITAGELDAICDRLGIGSGVA